MTASLYRQEAIDHYRNRLNGEVILDQPISNYVFTFIILMFVAVLVLILSFGSYPRKESVRGYLNPDMGLARVNAPASGVLSRLNVKEGDEVAVGDILLTVRVDSSDVNGSGYQKELLRMHSKRLEAHVQKLRGEKKLHDHRVQQVSSLIRGLETEVALGSQARKLLEQGAKRAEALVDKMDQQLAQGHLSQIKYQQLIQDHLDRKHNLLQSKLSHASLSNRIGEQRQRLQELILLWESKQADFKAQEAMFEEERIQLQARQEYTITSPSSGVVTSLMVSIGQAVDERSTLVSILPKGSRLEATLFVPSSAIGFVEPQQSVRIRYDAYPFQQYGSYHGKVLRVSEAAIDSENAKREGYTNEQVYLLVVELEEQEVSARRGKYKLHAGMGVEGDILLEERSLIQWIFDPLIAMKGG